MTTSRNGARKRSGSRLPRDQAPSSFTAILEDLLCAIPGARAAALVDFEGETIDYAGRLDPFDVKVTAAHWQIVLAEIASSPLGVPRQITVRAHRRSYIVRQLQPGYALVLVLHPRAAFAASHRALQEADVRLCAEAGWTTSRTTRWYCVDVETEASDRGRPARLRSAGGWQPVEVMGSMVGLGPREKGFRIRLPSGAEMLLIRERMGRWFADEHPET
ncbi:roadblock/LC7 domain-containing protein [Sorangium sp. So ce1389]|uniref:roadblock/LC7 domain-containing protein n=1 Tax=Sorangium sp. So ce1389 TaxID=3133336 RepID=UPI003F5EA7FF